MILNLTVPLEVAEEVTGEGLAVWPLETRGDPNVAVIAISLLGVASNMATVVASADTLHDIGRRVANWVMRRSPQPKSNMSIELEVTLREGSSVRLSTGKSTDEVAIKNLGDDLAQIIINLSAKQG